jgi:hypothetical protein
MGMFTSITHPQDGRELQIKCGYDNMETYKVGDPVDWEIWPDKPGTGKLLDGAYDSYSNGPDDWVIIKDHRVFAIVSRDSDLGKTGETGLTMFYGLVQFEASWWTPSAWNKHHLREAEAKKKQLEEDIEFFKDCLGRTDEEIIALRKKRFTQAMGAFVRESLTGQSFARQILPPK